MTTFYLFKIPDQPFVLQLWEHEGRWRSCVVHERLYPGSVHSAKVENVLNKTHAIVVEPTSKARLLVKTNTAARVGETLPVKVTHEAKMETLAFEDNEKYAKATPDIRIALGPLVYKKEGVTKLSFSHRAASEKQKVESALKAQLQEGDEVLCKQGISALTTQQLEAALHILRARWPQVQGSEGAALPHWVHAVISAQPEVIVTNLGDVHATLEDMAGVLKHKPTIQVTATLPDEVKDMLSMLYTDHVRMGKAASFIWGQTALGVFYDVNLSLAKADNALTQEIATRIVQHIMLGNFGGRILVDVPAQLNRNVFTKALQATLDRDILKTKLLGFTKSGLFEIVRPHYYVSTPHILTEGRLQKL